MTTGACLYFQPHDFLHVAVEYKGHADVLAPSVAELSRLEADAQVCSYDIFV